MMINTIPSFNSNHEELYIGAVEKAENGVAKIIQKDGELFNVSMVSDNLPFIEVGNKVIFRLLEEEVLLLYRLTAIKDHVPSYSPTYNDKSLIIEAGSSSISLDDEGCITIKAGNNQIQIDKETGLMCHSNRIELNAKENITLAAPENAIHIKTK